MVTMIIKKGHGSKSLKLNGDGKKAHGCKLLKVHGYSGYKSTAFGNQFQRVNSDHDNKN